MEVHQLWYLVLLQANLTTVKKCIGQSRISMQHKVIWGNGWYVEQDGK